MLEFIKFQDMQEINRVAEPPFTLYRIYHKPGKGTQSKKFPVLLQWTTYLRAWALHSTPETSLVNLFSHAGFDVYLVDWGDDSYFMPRGKKFEDYIQAALDIFDFVKQHSGKPKVHYFGVCEGSVYAQVIGSLRADSLKTLSFNDLILNSDNMGITNLLMDYFLVPMTDNPWMKAVSQWQNIPSFVNGPYLLSNLYSPMGLYLMGLNATKESTFKEYFWRKIWYEVDVREVELAHHITYAEVVYSNKIFKGTYSPQLEKEGKVKIHLKNISVPIYNIIGASDNFTEPAGSFIEKEQNPFGTPYHQVAQEVIPAGHNFWLGVENTDHVRKKWLEWLIENDS